MSKEKKNKSFQLSLLQKYDPETDAVTIVEDVTLHVTMGGTHSVARSIPSRAYLRAREKRRGERKINEQMFYDSDVHVLN